MTWDDLGKSSRHAAQTLKDPHPRSCVSRAYYAAFSVLNERLLPHEPPPPNYETHAHRRIPDLIEEHLFPGDARRRRSLRTMTRRLYNARLDADYRLSRTVDEATALGALRDAKAILNRWESTMPKPKRAGRVRRALTAKQVIALARRYLEPHQPDTYRLDVVEQGVRKDDDWWYVLVQPNREDARAYDYYGRLAEAEIDLKDTEHVNVLLVPVLPQ